MVLCIVAEFANDSPADDLKILNHTDTILAPSALEDIVVPAFMGLYSNGGNNPDQREGMIPLGNNKAAYAIAVQSPTVTRVLLVVVPSSEQNNLIKAITRDAVEKYIHDIKGVISTDSIDNNRLGSLLRSLSSELDVVDDASRISKVFGEEI